MRSFSGPRPTLLAHAVRRRHAFTLLELVLVIGVITLLSGILTMSLTDVMHKAENASLIANLTGLDKTVQLYRSMHRNQYPNRYDSLLLAGDTSSLYTNLPTGTSGIVGGKLTAKQLTAQHIWRLQKAGITTVYDMTAPTLADTNRNATYHAGTTERTLATDDYLVFTSSITKTVLDSTHEYVVLGIGEKCTMVGGGGGEAGRSNGTIKEAPVVIDNRHADTKDPGKVYLHAVAVFDLGVPDSSITSSADDKFVPRFIGTYGLGADELRISDEITNINYEF